jgi:ubiquinone/menaquinone biosynthesis C-methylase UbiE
VDAVGFFVCAGCGLVVQDPPPSPELLLRAYPEDYHAYHEYSNALMTFMKTRYYRRRAREYGRLVGRPSAVAVDVGCGDGNFIAELRRLHPGWTVHGLDFNPEVVARATKRGLSVSYGTLEEMPAPHASLDLIIMNHMIEHAFEPLATLQRCADLLKPGGLVVGETPSVDCWDFDRFGEYWGGLHAPRHTMLFTPSTLRRAAERAGLDVVWVRHAVQPAHIALSLQHWLQSRRRGRPRLHNGRAFYYPYLLLLLLPLAIAQAVRGRSGVINFGLRRPS